LSTPRNVKVLLYHRIIRDKDKADGDAWTIHESLFRRHLEVLDRCGFTTITFEDYQLSLEGELDLPRKPILITFDDGYAETYEVAFPILLGYGMKAVIYVLADRNITTNVWDGGNGASNLRLMSHQQILELRAAGFEIGSHSLTHPNLTKVPNSQAWEEISRSRMLLEILLNAPVRAFSYPYGFLDVRTKRMAAEAGYRFACAAWSGPARFEDDPFEIRRIVIPRDLGLLGFVARLFPTYQYYRWFWWQLRRLFNFQDKIRPRTSH